MRQNHEPVHCTSLETYLAEAGERQQVWGKEGSLVADQ
jgi:hypothetical protein